jgi:hypothetical protein
MWIFTVNGFFTFVIDRKDPDMVWLRARLREDLERNFPGVTVEEHPGADYLFRAKISRADLAEHMVRLIAEADVTSHFKDEMIRRAAKPEFGNRSSMMYALWTAGAAMQPYAPYSKTPRAKVQPKTWKPGDRTVGGGQLPAFSGSSSGGRYASEFDWDNRNWGGTQAKDPSPVAPLTATDEELDEWWASLTDDERDAVLDEEEAALRAREEAEEDFASAARTFGVVAADVFPAPRNRPGNRRQRRKNKRKNRHNQTQADFDRYAQERRDGKHGSEARNRQAFLDKQAKGGTR